jgi:hypothetical protein
LECIWNRLDAFGWKTDSRNRQPFFFLLVNRQ